MPLLAALRVVVDADVEDPTDPRYVAVDRVEELLTSPVGGLDATDVRCAGPCPPGPREAPGRGGGGAGTVLARAAPPLRARSRAARRRRRRPRRRGASPRRPAGPGTRACSTTGGTAEEALWVLWNGTDWGRRLRRRDPARRQRRRASPTATSTRCARCSRPPSKAEEQRGHTSVQSFLDTLTAQEIPADTLADRGVRGDAVRLLTAHRSKGLEWRLVVVAHVQDGAWPDLRRRGSLLGPDRIGRDGLLPPVTTAAMLAEERRLFYVACTRARERLVVTAVRSPDDEGEQPSRFVRELGPRAAAQGRPTVSAAVAARPGRRAPAHRRRPRPTRRAAPRGRRAGWPGWRTDRGARPPGRAAGRPGDLVGDAAA